MEFTNVVVLEAPLNVTNEPETKFVPFTVKVNAPEPAAALAGEILLMVGTGLLAAFTTCVRTSDVLPAKFVSPP